jgi:(4-(4-[2-(gamma-L-glutamylamino)ethyl]phenoxymethyl)furan-2-yl)methanamine synthase
MSAAILGLDIGGANLKAAHSNGRAWSRPFALWKRPQALTSELQRLIAEVEPPATHGWFTTRVAVTMTGELCDCFPTSRAGVLHILDAVAATFPKSSIHVWRTDGNFVSFDGARIDPMPCAASNWLALATFAGRFAPPGPALLVDIGSTTTDLVPLHDGIPMPKARTDPDRLKAGELIYTGIRRTPACALMGTGGAAEFFATTLDVYLLLERIAEDVADTDTADGRPATRQAAHSRLARMLCGDGETIPRNATLALAKRLSLIQRLAIDRAARQSDFRGLILSGVGEFLVREVFAEFEGPVVSLAEKLSPERSAAACAVAVAQLLSEPEA